MQISIKTLGELQVFHNDQPVKLPASRLARALMIYLLLSTRPQRREHLCELFWHKTNDPRGALRWSLSKLRLIFNDANIERVLADRGQVSILSADIDIDINQIAARLGDPNIQPFELKAITQQLNSPLLDGADLYNHSHFQNWLTAQRQHIAELRTKALGHLSAQDTLDTNNPQTLDKHTIQDQGDGLSQKSPQNIHFCAGKDGVNIAYTSLGQGFPIVKPPALLSHLQYDWQGPVWGRAFHQLAANHQFIRYDGRGTGMSERNITGLCFDDFVQDLETVIDTSRLSKFALLGISHGAATSIEYAVRHPERVSHLILFSSFALGWHLEDDPAVQEKIAAIISLAESGWDQENTAFRQFFSMTFMPDANQQELDWFNEFLRLSATGKNASCLMSAISYIDIRDKLAKVTVPTLVIHSLGDEAIPVITGRDIAATIPGAEFVGLESRSHLLLEREPAAQEFIDAVQDFITRR